MSYLGAISRLPQAEELEAVWEKRRLSRADSLLWPCPLYYLGMASIVGVFSGPDKLEDRIVVEEAARWGDMPATLLHLLVIREDADRVQAMPGGDTEKDRKRVVDEHNAAIEFRQQGEKILQKAIERGEITLEYVLEAPSLDVI